MSRQLRIGYLCVAISAAFATVATMPCQAGTIVKLGLGGDAAADIEFDGTTLGTVNQFDGTTTGHQNTNVEFQGFLDGLADIVGPPPASFTLSGLTTSGTASVFPAMNPVLVIQDFTGGTFELYNTANVLLLSGKLNNSAMTGPIGPPATGALFTTSFAEVTGGTLANLLDLDSLTMSMSLTDINSGVGLTLDAAAPLLNPFHSDVTLNIAADPVPEPAGRLLIAAAAIAWLASWRPRELRGESPAHQL